MKLRTLRRSIVTLLLLLSLGWLFLWIFGVAPLPGKGFREYSMEDLKAEDKNENGIWDDIEVYVDSLNPTERQRMALFFQAKTYQSFLLNPEIGLELKELSLQPWELKRPDFHSRSSACLRQEMGPKATLSFQDAVINNWVRAAAYARYNGNLGGGMYSLWVSEQHGNPCPF